MRHLDISASPLYDYSRRPYSLPIVEPQDNEFFLRATVGEGRLWHRSRSNVVSVDGMTYPVPGTSLVVQSAHQAFSEHFGLRLSPVLLMDIIVRELAIVIKGDPERYRYLFVARSGRELIRVEFPFSDWPQALRNFSAPLRAGITDETFELFMPRFSTLSDEEEIAQLVALMNAASPYFRYEVETLCGIPTIELEGSQEDWELLVQSVTRVQPLFPELRAYLSNVLSVLEEVANSAISGQWDDRFWHSLYKYESHSGGAWANGWLTTLFAHEQTPDGPRRKPDEAFDWSAYGNPGVKLNAFPSGLSVVPFIWRNSGRQIPMRFVAGALGIDYTDRKTLAARLGFAVIEG